MKQSTIYDYWREFKTQKKPPYIKLQGNKRKLELTYELAMIFPLNRWSKKTFVRDSLGRLIEAKMENNKFRIKEIIPYWEEELVYDFNAKKRIRYHKMMEQIMSIDEIAQIFTLNNKLFIQVDEQVILFGNKNIADTERLFEIVRTDLLKRKKGNFMFVRDVSSHQRTILYDLLVSKGFKRTELFRHYSY